jgi:ComF family protein
MACAILNGVFFMLLKKIINLLFPQKCMFCQRITEGEHICFSCRGTLPYRDAFVEGVSLPTPFTRPSGTGNRDGAIHRFKFSGQSFLAEPFGELIADCLRQHLRHGVDLVTWVPVNRFRKRRRGYDQAQLLAEQVAKALALPCCPTLVKQKNIAPQFTMADEKSRRENVENVYGFSRKSDVAGKRVLLIDDIITTGATLSVCCEALLRAGASGVVCAAIAKAGENKG